MKPFMSDSSIELIKSYLKTNNVFLEYGCGGSTLYFAQFVEKYISIEHNIEWFEKVNLQILNNTTLHFCPPNNKDLIHPIWKGTKDDFHDYINYIDKISNKRYDAVLIDGRSRIYCAEKILEYIDKDSVVFFHDFFERPRYHSIIKYYDIIDMDYAKKPSLAVLRKKYN